MPPIAIGSDHAGLDLKEKVKQWLELEGIQVLDQGCFTNQSCHYPEFGKKVAHMVAHGEVERGVLICGTGIGMSIAANRYQGVRATLCHNVETAQMAREHNNSNILVMGARVLAEDLAKEILLTWLKTPFAGGRHQDRLNLIEQP